MITIKAEDIIEFAKDIRSHWGSDPFKIAERLGIAVNFLPGSRKDAFLIQADNYPMMINISRKRLNIRLVL